ncbi:MAG: hypothetical protein V4679_03100 [Pseudomonadota bacterium]
MRDFFVLRWPLLRPLAWLAVLLPAMAGAQPPSAAAGPAPAATPQDPQSPLAPPAYTPLQVQPPLPGADAPLADWRAAHEAVAAFPRGHADIVRWETGQGAAPAAHHQGHKP